MCVRVRACVGLLPEEVVKSDSVVEPQSSLGEAPRKHTEPRVNTGSHQPPLGLSDRPPQGLSDRPPLGLSDRPPLGLSDRPPLGLSDRPPLGLSDRP